MQYCNAMLRGRVSMPWFVPIEVVTTPEPVSTPLIFVSDEPNTSILVC